MRVLVADDDPVSRRLLESTVRRLGHDVTAVADGLAAIEALLHSDGPRLAVLDWMMPGADGLAVCHAVRTRASRYVYVILLTGMDRREDMVTALDAEADDFLTKPLDVIELRARLRSGERVLELQERLLDAQENLRHDATHDRLTGLWNRGMVLDHLALAVRQARREHRQLAVVMADIDHFKDVNDRHGHAAGDRLLGSVATRMRSVLRQYDRIGRYGGEEFLIVLPNCEAQIARQVAERVRAAVAASPIEAGDVSLPVSISLGVAWSANPAENPAALLDEADQALYRAKAAGRNRVEG
jgi:two-component system, cell cycle response regulator